MGKNETKECKPKADINGIGGRKRFLFKNNDIYEFKEVLRIVSNSEFEIWYSVKSRESIEVIFSQKEFFEKFISGFDLIVDDAIKPLIKQYLLQHDNIKER